MTLSPIHGTRGTRVDRGAAPMRTCGLSLKLESARMELVAVVKRECETCKLVEPVLAQIRAAAPLALYSQDDPAFPEALGGAIDDTALERSWRLKHRDRADADPLRRRAARSRASPAGTAPNGSALRKQTALGAGLPPFQPGCGSRTQDPGMPERLALAHGDLQLNSRRIEVADPEDAIEVAYDRGWSDGLPVVPPTPLRVAMMLSRHHAQARRSDRTHSAEPRRMHRGESRRQRRDGRLPARIFPGGAGGDRGRARAAVFHARACWPRCGSRAP